MSKTTQTQKGGDLDAHITELLGTSEIDEMLAIKEVEKAEREAQEKVNRQRELVKKFQAMFTDSCVQPEDYREEAAQQK